VSPEAHDPRVVTESNFPDSSKETAVGSVGFKSTTSISPSSELSHELRGQPVQGESDVLQVCRSLQEALHRTGVEIVGSFHIPEGRETGIDAEGKTTTGSVVRVQVVGVIDQETMAALGRDGRVSSQRNAEELANDICSAIKRKSKAYPDSQRAEVLLALDAIKSPAHVTPEVVMAVTREPCVQILRSSGFASIWLVGPIGPLTHQLDPLSAVEGSEM
jgi:hypothetical protein